MIQKLISVVCSLTVVQQQSKFFHWIASGKSYFMDHKFLDDLAGDLSDVIDLLTERLVFLGGTPFADLTDVVNHSSVDSYSNSSYDQGNTFRVLNGQLTMIVDLLKEISILSQESRDFGTDSLVQDTIYKLEQWQYHIRQFIGRD